jgi:hypothetical protein
MDFGAQPDECYVQLLPCLHSPLYTRAVLVGADNCGINHRVLVVCLGR